MSTLHIVRQSAFNTSDYSECSKVIKSHDAIVFCDDGCYNLSHSITNLLLDEKTLLSFKVIKLHARARAIKIPSTVEAINMGTLVDLTFQHDKVITWQ
jgi:tRNA 2-thiouridine synthesizing protein B